MGNQPTPPAPASFQQRSCIVYSDLTVRFLGEVLQLPRRAPFTHQVGRAVLVELPTDEPEKLCVIIDGLRHETELVRQALPSFAFADDGDETDTAGEIPTRAGWFYRDDTSTAAFRASVRPPTECAVCANQVLASAVQHDPRLGQLCPRCHQQAEFFDSRFEAAVQRQRTDYARQLAQLIRDRIGGAPEPDFYRGDIA